MRQSTLNSSNLSKCDYIHDLTFRLFGDKGYNLAKQEKMDRTWTQGFGPSTAFGPLTGKKNWPKNGAKAIAFDLDK